MNVHFGILPGRGASPVELDRYVSAYDTFHSVWQDTLGAIDGNGYVHHSNDFTRQDYIQALFGDGGACVALDCVRAVALDNPVDLQDSWLHPWPAEVLRDLASEHAVAWINSYFTVHPAHRKTLCHDAHPVSYVMGCLSVLHQLESGVPLMLGMMRRDRSMNALGKRLGADTLLTTTHNGIETDLVVFRIDGVRQAMTKFPSLASELFARRIDLCEERPNEQSA
jgi:hypothetical protein